MKKSELMEAICEIPDDAEIDIIVWDGADNWSCLDNISIDTHQDSCEMIVTLDSGYFVEYDKERDEDAFIKSMEYICESIINGQWKQAVRIFVDNDYSYREFDTSEYSYGITEESKTTFRSMVREYEN